MYQGFDGRDGIPGASGLPGPPGNVFIIDVSCFKTNFIVQAFGCYKSYLGYCKIAFRRRERLLKFGFD